MLRAPTYVCRLGLGTVQFGLDYGISNTAGKCSGDNIAEILRIADGAGLEVIDTATDYGDSERALGHQAPADHSFKFVTKLPRLTSGAGDDVSGWVWGQLQSSLTRLRRPRIYGLLVHHCSDLLSEAGGSLYHGLRAAKEAGLIEKIGVSIYSAEQAVEARRRYDLDIVQFPISVFDQRLLATGQLAAMKDSGIELHARSLFLQGVLLMQPDQLPQPLSALRSHLARFHTVIAEAGMTPLQATLTFIKQLTAIDHALVGVCSPRQLEAIVKAFQSDRPDTDFAPFAVDDPKLVDPSQWCLSEAV